MNVHWKKLLVRITFWLVTEFWFGSIGIDVLADYSEFVFKESEVVQRYSKPIKLSKNSDIMLDYNNELK